MPRPKIEPVAVPIAGARTVQKLRARLRMTQQEFADAFALPWATVRDWEQGRSRPDRAALAYLHLIGWDAEGVRTGLAWRPEVEDVPAPPAPMSDRDMSLAAYLAKQAEAAQRRIAGQAGTVR